MNRARWNWARCWCGLLLAPLSACESAGSGGSPQSSNPAPQPAPAAREQIRGVALFHLEDAGRGYGSEPCRQSLLRARELGVRAVSLRVPARQATIRSSEVRFDVEAEHGETEAAIRAAARQARELGLTVMVKPHLILERITADEWRGRIDFEDPAELERWWSGYRAFVLRYARVAAEEEVEIYCVGVELLDMVRRAPERWRALIAAVREVYPGRLTYAANWDAEVAAVPFWDELDLISVQFFYPVASGASPSAEALAQGLERPFAELEALSQRHAKPVLLTEVGYKSCEHATDRPWEWPRGDETYDPQLQARAYQAVLEGVASAEWCAGLFWWNWFTEPEPGEWARTRFTPQGKPAEDVLRRQWSRDVSSQSR